MASSAKSATPKLAASSGKPSTWTTAAMIIPMLLWGIDKWPQISSKITWDNWDIRQLVPSVITPVISNANANANTNANAIMNATDSRIEMANRYAEACPDHRHNTRVFSTDPLIIYVEGFVGAEEAEYLLALAEPHYIVSPLSGPDGKTYDDEIRKSLSAVVPDDPVVACIRQRAAAFQGLIPLGNMEDIQVVKYGISGQFRPHFDWHPGMLNPRMTTLFVYLACDDPINGGTCEGGETGFPRWTGPFTRAWCQLGFVNCSKSIQGGGIYFAPVPGNGVFWANFYPNGTGVEGAYHAGMPLQKGRKVGLNIFGRRDEFTSDILEIHDRSQLSKADRARCDAESKEGPCIIEVQ